MQELNANLVKMLILPVPKSKHTVLKILKRIFSSLISLKWQSRAQHTKFKPTIRLSISMQLEPYQCQTYLDKPFIKSRSIISWLTITISTPTTPQIKLNQQKQHTQRWIETKKKKLQTRDLRSQKEKSKRLLFELFLVFIVISRIIILLAKSQSKVRIHVKKTEQIYELIQRNQIIIVIVPNQRL